MTDQYRKTRKLVWLPCALLVGWLTASWSIDAEEGIKVLGVPLELQSLEVIPHALAIWIVVGSFALTAEWARSKAEDRKQPFATTEQVVYLIVAYAVLAVLFFRQDAALLEQPSGQWVTHATHIPHHMTAIFVLWQVWLKGRAIWLFPRNGKKRKSSVIKYGFLAGVNGTVLEFIASVSEGGGFLEVIYYSFLRFLGGPMLIGLVLVSLIATQLDEISKKFNIDIHLVDSLKDLVLYSPDPPEPEDLPQKAG